MDKNSFKDIYIYGEVLFDCFTNGEDKLGGAPFNVAWNLKGLGLNPKMITSIGNDTLGKKILDMMKIWDIDISYVNIVEDKKTGNVQVSVDKKGIPSYTIEDDCAYDYIDIPKNISENSIFYHGSLALRHKYNQDKCKEIKSMPNLSTFVDINLRAPWWNSDTLKEILVDSKSLKINDEELPLLCESYGEKNVDEKRQIDFIFEKLDLELLVLTKGSQGAVLINKDKKMIEMPIVEVDNMVDTVGAGDAFASIVIYGLYNKWDDKLILKRAMNFASKVCSLNGAITQDVEFYKGFLEEWENSN